MRIVIGNKAYDLPGNWDDITIKQLCNLEGSDDILTIFKVLTGIPKKKLSKVVFDRQMEKAIMELNFLNELPKFEVKSEFKHNGKQYRLNPEINEMPFGMYSDALRLEKNAKTELERITKIVGTITLEQGQEEYSFRKTEARAKEFESLPVPIAYGIANFFLMGQKIFTSDTREYSRLNRKLKSYRLALKVYRLIGAISSRFTIWPKKVTFWKKYMAKKKQ